MTVDYMSSDVSTVSSEDQVEACRRREKACLPSSPWAIGESHRAHESPRPEVHTETNSSRTTNDLRKSGGLQGHSWQQYRNGH